MKIGNMELSYNFRLGPEAIWLILNTVVATLLLELIATDFATLPDLGEWGRGLLIGLLGRTLPAAILAAASGGGFQRPGEPGPNTVVLGGDAE